MKQVHKEITDKCPTCNGDGFYLDYSDGEETGKDSERKFECHDCNGTGLLTNKNYDNGEFTRR